MTEFFLRGWGASKDSVHAGEPTALGELRPKYFIEDRLEDTDVNSDTVCVCKCAVKIQSMRLHTKNINWIFHIVNVCK
jgi:hypothetical protein